MNTISVQGDKHEISKEALKLIHSEKRISADEYYIEIAKAASLRSTCTRAKVGCVLVYDDMAISTGYNGSLPKHKHCIDVGCVTHNGHCIQTIHAEINALKRAIKAGYAEKLTECTLYSTHRPCYSCIKTLAAFGINNIVYLNMYKDDAAEAYINLIGMNVRQLKIN